MTSKMSKERLKEYLDNIDVRKLEYSDWIKVGMAMKHEGFSVDEWEAWSSHDPRHKSGECEYKWETFNEDGFDTVTGGTIVSMAKDQGYSGVWQENNRILGWNDIISQEVPDDVVVERIHEEVKLQAPGEDWEGYKDTIKYLETLYSPDEYVGYVVKASMTDDGKYYPGDRGVYTRTAGELIDSLKKYKNEFGYSLGTYTKEAGAWIRVNPLDGQGIKNENVAMFNYALVESDDMAIDEQVAFLKDMKLPIATMVYSGGKSVHALVKIKANSYTEYKTKVNYLYEVLDKNGFSIDRQNRNPSRLSRLPGVYRSGKKQWLMATNIGHRTFEEWQDWIEEVNDDLGDPELPPEDNKRPELADELIGGILREGHKMMIAGPSKAGKSFLLLQLGIAIARGSTWLGRTCKKGRVMYVNLELDSRSAWARIYDILAVSGKKYDDLEDNFLMWNLRGKSAPMDKLAKKIIRRAEKDNYSAIIIDPIYKVLTGDENNAQDMARFTNQFDKVATSLGCAVIYCHHHSKGYQGQKKSMDRASGSGVFARDPDALLDMTQLEVDNKEKYGFRDKHTTAWRVEGTLREFEEFDPIDIYFEYPAHRVDSEGVLKDLQTESEKPPWQRGNEKSRKTKQSKKEVNASKFDFEFLNRAKLEDKTIEDFKIPVDDMAKHFGVTKKTIRNWMEDKDLYGDYFIENGSIYYKENQEDASK